jgi:hypothetical protein
MEYIIWCDESIEHDKYFSNFYGGVLVKSVDLDNINKKITETKLLLNLKNEVKWTKVTENYLNKYIELINVFFDYIESNKVKIRIMFTQNTKNRIIPNEYQYENKYFLLYYQFIKHAFGLKYADDFNVNLRFYFDKLPNNKGLKEVFINYIYGLQYFKDFKKKNLIIKKENITEVDSKRHNILQCLDIILGSIAFKLNKHDKEKQPGSKMRGKRTIAKEKLYKEILQRIRIIYPNFNIGITTGKQGDYSNYWNDPYRHWIFIPNSTEE